MSPQYLRVKLIGQIGRQEEEETMDFMITDTKPLNKKTLKGKFSLIVGPFKISDFTFHTKRDKSWIGFPSRQYTDYETGETKYWPIIRIEDDERYKAFQRWAKDQVKEVFSRPATAQNATMDDDAEIPF